MRSTLATAARLLGILTVLTGVVYPLSITALAHWAWPAQAAGSLAWRDGHPVGSRLLAQPTRADRYVWPRPSAADFATVPSGASNLGPTSAALATAVTARAGALRAAHGLAPTVPLPADLLHASGSGLDPHVSPAAARLQVRRVAAARGLPPAAVAALVEQAIEPPQFGLLGDARVNVLQLNLALDALH